MKTNISETETNPTNTTNIGGNKNDKSYFNIQLTKNSDAMSAFSDFPFQHDESCPYSIKRKGEMMITTLMESFANTRLELIELFTEEEFAFFVSMFFDDDNTLFYGTNWFLTEIENTCKYYQLDAVLSLDKEIIIKKVANLSYFQALCLRLMAISYRNEPNNKSRLTFRPNNIEDVNKFKQIFGFSESFKKYVKYYVQLEF